MQDADQISAGWGGVSFQSRVWAVTLNMRKFRIGIERPLTH